MLSKYYFYLAVVYVGTIMQVSCNNDRKKPKTDIQSKEFQDRMVDANKMHVKQESDEIDQYVKHKGWQMTTTGTGLRYMIIKHGTGVMPKTGQKVKLNFNVKLLDGTICYSSDSTGAYQFVVDQSAVESGLHEGVKYMHVGDKAVMILPSHLAYGLVGDENKIPPRASVLYELELLSVE